MPSFTFVSTANAMALRMATPVFVNVGDDLNMDITAVKVAVTPKKKNAIMVVHHGGNACDMDDIMHLAKEKDLYVIEDAAQAFLSKYKGRWSPGMFIISLHKKYGLRRRRRGSPSERRPFPVPSDNHPRKRH